MSRKVYIMRGVPGSGKSTTAAHMHQKEGTGVILSTDDFFYDTDRVYTFNSRYLSKAHEWNQERFKEHLILGTSPIWVDNTNTQKWEARFYVEHAIKNHYEVEFVQPETSWRRDALICSQKNSHGVGVDVIERMISRWEDDFTIESVLEAN